MRYMWNLERKSIGLFFKKNDFIQLNTLIVKAKYVQEYITI